MRRVPFFAGMEVLFKIGVVNFAASDVDTSTLDVSHASFAQRVASETCLVMVLLLRPVGKSGGRGGDVGDCSMRTNADALFEIGGAEMSTRAAAIAVKSVTTMAGALAAERTGDW